MPEVPRYSKILVRPALESYGNFMKVHLDGDENVTLELYALNPMCCSHKFVGRLTHDGNLIEGNWPSGPNQTPDSGSWAKIAGDSCVSSVPPRPRQNEID
jgi:hypothetical protein